MTRNPLIVYDGPDNDMERAKRAVQRFRTMLPGLNGYVRAISGSKTLHIELAAGQPRTDGRKIYLEPPIALGDDLTHERRLCDKRDPETYKQLCYGCEVREDLLIKIYHEIAHNIYGTFQTPVQGMDLKQKIYKEVNKLEPRRAKTIQDKLWNLKTPPSSYLELAAHVNPFLPTLVNALEDLRVDEAMFKARKGTRAMFYAMTRTTFVEGVQQLDGSVSRWKDMPLNHQALVGIFVLGCRYKFNGWFDPKVEEALNDDLIKSLVKDVDEMKSSLETFERAFPILERLRELGFCLTEEEYDDKDQEEQENKEQEDGEQGDEGKPDPSQESGDSGSDRSAEPSPEEAGESDHDSSDESGGSGAPSAGDEESSGDGGSMEESSAEQVQEPSGEVSPESGDSQDDDGVADEESSEAGTGSSDDSDSDHGDRPERSDEDESGDDRREGEDEEEGDGGSPREPGGADDAEASPDSDLDELSDDSPLDSGADKGEGGISLKELYGTQEGLEDAINAITKHGDHAEPVSQGGVEDRTIIQSLYFEKESGTVSTVVEHYYGDSCSNDAWTRAQGQSAQARRRRGADIGDLMVGEDVLGPALLHMRRVFADNARAQVEPHLRSGRVNARVLGKRAPFHDPRLFQKKRLPGKRSYAVLIGIDISGSTIGLNIALAKLAAHAQAELCSRLGIDFAVYAHSASPLGGTYSLDMYAIKDFDSPWDKRAQHALLSIGSWTENLDGHSLEYYRKKIERHPATDKIILYYTDGKMPAANYSEELVVLQREIETCRRKSITLLGVGIRTDSPTKHGLDTVQVDGPETIGKVVKHLESRILHRR